MNITKKQAKMIYWMTEFYKHSHNCDHELKCTPSTAEEFCRAMESFFKALNDDEEQNK